MLMVRDKKCTQDTLFWFSGVVDAHLCAELPPVPVHARSQCPVCEACGHRQAAGRVFEVVFS